MKTLYVAAAIFLSATWLAAQQQTGQAQPQPAPQQAAPPQPLPAEPAKIGFIDFERALTEVEEGKREFGALQKFVDEKSAELKIKQDELEKLRKQLQTQDRTLNDEARASLQRDIERKETDLRRFTEDTQRDIDSRRNVVVQRIGTKMQPIINSFAKEKGLGAVFVVSNQTVFMYAYLDPAYDITDEVIQRYNQAHPLAPAQAAQPPKEAPKQPAPQQAKPAPPKTP